MNKISPSVVVFDLDGTLVEGDSFGLFCFGRAKRAPLRVLVLVLALPLVLALALPQKGRRKRVLSVVLWVLTLGMTEADYQSETDLFVEQRFQGGVHHVITESLVRLRAHAACGSTLVIVTGCEERLGRRIAKSALGLDPMPIVVGSRIERKWGGFVAKFHCLGRAKLTALERADLPPPYEFAYTDSPLDLPLLLAAETGVLVRPSQRGRAIIETQLPRVEILGAKGSSSA